MSNLHLQNVEEVPPGGFRFKDPSTGVTITGPTYRDWVNKVKKHRIANVVPVGVDLEAEMQEQLCLQMPAGICVRDGTPYSSGVMNGLTFDQVINGTVVLGEWLLTGKKKATREEAQQRTNVCAACPFNQPVTGCTSCNQGKLLNVVNRIVGPERLQGDDKLQACTLCGCSLKAKVWIDLDILKKHTGGVNFPEWCWMKKEKTE